MNKNLPPPPVDIWGESGPPSSEEQIIEIWESDVLTGVPAALHDKALEEIEFVIAHYKRQRRTSYGIDRLLDDLLAVREFKGRNDYRPLLLAVLLHAVHDDPEKKQCVEDSARFAVYLLNDIGLTSEMHDVVRLIHATKAPQRGSADELIVRNILGRYAGVEDMAATTEDSVPA